jgi:hypothetical protein
LKNSGIFELTETEKTLVREVAIEIIWKVVLVLTQGGLKMSDANEKKEIKEVDDRGRFKPQIYLTINPEYREINVPSVHDSIEDAAKKETLTWVAVYKISHILKVLNRSQIMQTFTPGVSVEEVIPHPGIGEQDDGDPDNPDF